MSRFLIRMVGLTAVCLITAFCSAVAGDEKTADKTVWLWPPPQKLEMLQGALSLEHVAVMIPDGAGRAVTAIAGAVGTYAGFHLKKDISVTVVKDAPELPYAIVLAGVGDESAYAKLAATADVDAIPRKLPGRRMWRREAYVLRITPEGAVIAAPEVPGLLQGARTLMQLVRIAAGTNDTTLPALSIVDWPDMPRHILLARQSTTYLRTKTEKRMSAMSAGLKYNQMIIALRGGVLSYPLHPELKTSDVSEKLPAWVSYVRSLGMPVYPWMLSAAGGPTSVGPMAYYLDTDEFYRVKFEMIDRALEVFRPDSFHFCNSFHFSESDQDAAARSWNGRVRSKGEYIANLVKLSNFCLRRGVTPSIWGDNFLHSKRFLPREDILTADPEAVRRIPRELIIIPWCFVNLRRYERPWEKLAGTEFGFRVMNTCGRWKADGSYHAQHMAGRSGDLPLMWGVAAIWGKTGPDDAITAFNRCAGSLWNCRLGTHPVVVAVENRGIMGAAPYNVGTPDFLEPLGLEAVLWREPKGTVSEYVEKLRSPDVLVWENAREELVGFGAGGAVAILDAMVESSPVESDGVYEGTNRPLRWKLEGVLSRICRDGRHGEAVGELDVEGVVKHLGNRSPYVRDVAAELIASCAPRKKAIPIIRNGLTKAGTRASCARAAGVTGMTEIAPALVSIVTDGSGAMADRVAAARYLGYLKPGGTGPALPAALKGAEDAVLTMELIRTLSLIGAKDAEKEIARHLDAGRNTFVRIRALIALVHMESEKVGGVESWLAENDHAIVELGCWALGRVHGSEAVEMIRRNVEKQEDETLKQALEFQIAKRTFLRW